MESELDRLNILKRENLERFISTVRVELNTFWNKCMFGDMQRREFEPAYNGKQYIASGWFSHNIVICIVRLLTNSVY